jgi:DNA helicase-2/ATP-dependent DNA helicase PcrA
VLTTRIAWLIQTGQLSPGGVMAVTFTNKAAKEMLTRLGAMLPIRARHVDRHLPRPVQPLPARALEAGRPAAGLPDPRFADQLSAVKRVIKAMNLDEERFVPKQVTWFIAGSKEEGLRPKDVEVRDEQTASRSRSTRPTKTSASAKAWSTSPS